MTAAPIGTTSAPELSTLVERVLDGTYPNVDAVLVEQAGVLFFEEYFQGWDRNRLHEIQSCTKSVFALLVGIGLEHGWISDLDDEAWTYLGAHPNSRWVRERYPVTVRELLSMSAQLEWNERVPYGDPANDNTRMNESGDWIRYVLERPLQGNRAAGRFEYQSGCSILLGEILHETTGRTVPDLARDYLFDPLSIDPFTWSTTSGGVAHTGGGLSLRPRDLLLIGQLMLQCGLHSGRQIVPASWCTEVGRQHSSNATADYGLHWWLLGDARHGLGKTCMSALGYGGQALHVLPELDAVAVTLASDPRGSGSYLEMLRDHIIPALSLEEC